MKEKGFELTSVAYRKNEWKERYERSQRLMSGEEKIEIKTTGEEGVHQLCALFGLDELVTNVNIPNRGQIPNLPLGAVVETNAVFRANSLEPVFAGEIPKEIYPLVSRICSEQELLSDAIAERNIEKIFSVFANDPLVICSVNDARKLFEEMCENTKKYLTMYQ